MLDLKLKGKVDSYSVKNGVTTLKLLFTSSSLESFIDIIANDPLTYTISLNSEISGSSFLWDNLKLTKNDKLTFVFKGASNSEVISNLWFDDEIDIRIKETRYSNDELGNVEYGNETRKKKKGKKKNE